MKQELEHRLKELRVEFESGQKMLADLESKQANLRDTLLHISGAIQMLEELSTTLDGSEGVSEQSGESSEKLKAQKLRWKLNLSNKTESGDNIILARLNVWLCRTPPKQRIHITLN